ncbi:MAG: T9SS type A sorting domain-containing protein [Bacteroidetes bacterium]|nr:T9SS type A sorting domain-containing protein [Bacteroidota bacterium]
MKCFNDVVQINGVQYTRDSISNILREAFDYSNYTQALVDARISQYGDSVTGVFNIIPGSGPDPIVILNTMNTMTFSVYLGPTSPDVLCVLNVVHVDSSVLSKSINYKIHETNWGFLEAIQVFAENDLLEACVLNNGTMPVNINSSEPVRYYDFILNEPRTCTDHISTLVTSNETFIRAPVVFTKNSDFWEFDEINKSVSLANLGRELISSIDDAAVTLIDNGSEVLVSIVDRKWIRFTTFKFSGTDITSCPYMKADNTTTGQRFYLPGYIKYDHYGYGIAYILDFARKDLSRMKYGNYPPHMFDAEWVKPIISPDITPKGLDITWTPDYSGTVNAYVWFATTLPPYKVFGFKLHDTAYDFGSPYYEITKIMGECDKLYHYFDTKPPAVSLDVHFGQQSNRWNRYEAGFAAGEEIILADISAINNATHEVEMAYGRKIDIGHKLIVPSIEQTVDGAFFVSDMIRGVFHLVDGYSGRYVASIKPDYKPDFNRPVAVRMIKTNDRGYYDAYIFEQWSDTSGISRAWYAADVVLHRRINSQASRTASIVIGLTGRCNYSVRTEDQIIIDNVKTGVAVENITVPNAYNKSVFVSIISEAVANGAPVVDKEIEILPDGSVIKRSGAGRNAENRSPVSIDIYPNPATSESRIRVKSGESIGEINVSIFDISGKLIQSYGIMIPGKYYESHNLIRSLHPGIYFIAVRTMGDQRIYKLAVM